MFVEWSWLVGLYLGATIGSFLNVVIYRMPRGISLANPPKSFCPRCKHSLGIGDLFPLFSWMLLKGKCRYCGAKVSPRYFFVELLNGLIWGGIWWRYLVVGWEPARAIAFALAAACLVAVIFIDWELYIIPDQLNAFLLFVGLGLNAYLYATGSPAAETWGIPSSVAGALCGVGVLWGIAFLGRLLFRKDAMGHGDIKMARGIGAVLFPTMALLSFAVAVVLGAVLGIAQVLLLKEEEPVLVAGKHLKEEASLPLVPPGEPEPVSEGENPAEEEELPPESIASLLWCGLGYLLCIDVIGLFFKGLYIKWFGEDPFTPVQEMDDYEVERTMIPFGPYLALGAIVAMVFRDPLEGVWNAYSNWVRGGPSLLEQPGLFWSLF